MALIDRIERDRGAVFMNPEHFATEHTWNGKKFRCVTDEEEALKRKNNNVVDLAWDNNTREVLVYVREEDWPGKKRVNDHGIFDRRDMKVLQIAENFGILEIMLVENDPKAVET